MRLQLERDELTSRVRDGRSASTPPESHQQPAEQPLDDVAHDLEFKSREAVYARIASIDAALDRIKSGRYGECEGCGLPVGERRISNDAAAALCLDCQAASERPQRRSTM